MTPALRWAATRAILMFHNCEGQSHKKASTDHNLWKERRAGADSNRGSSAHHLFATRPNRLMQIWIIFLVLNTLLNTQCCTVRQHCICSIHPLLQCITKSHSPWSASQHGWGPGLVQRPGPGTSQQRPSWLYKQLHLQLAALSFWPLAVFHL